MPDTKAARRPKTSGVQATEHTMPLRDGTDLFFRAWWPSRPADKALFLFHRGHEHSGRLCDVVDQPWHPQLEMIARVLINREGKPWVMRRRTQAEMDALVRSMGFEKIGMEIDDQGMFTVSVARLRRAS